MKVKLRAPMNSFLTALFSLMTFGFYPLLKWAVERRYLIVAMDDSGIQTRGGRKIAWGDIIDIEHVITKVNGIQRTDDYVIRSCRASASLTLWRAENAREAMDFLLARIPREALGRRSGRRT